MFDSEVDSAASRAAGSTGRHRLPQPLADLADRLDRAGVGRLDAAVLDEGVGDQRHLVALVVEGDQHVGDHQRHVGQADRVGVGLAERLDGAHQVVAEEADRAAGERRQLVGLGDLVAAEVLGGGAVGIGRLGDAVGSRPRRSAPSRHPLGQLPVAQRRIARGRKPRKDQRPSRPCSADSSRKAGPVAAQLEEGADRRLAVVDEPVADRDHVGASRASSRARSRSGSRPGRSGRRLRRRSSSPPAAVQDLQHLGHRDAAREQQHRQVVDDVGPLLGHPLLGLAS